ncbi:MAG: hydrogenase maturation protease [Candidatus Aminicenantes bacterium]
MLVLGIGNPGRRDDGLGAEAVARLEALRLPGVTADANYQLNLEDALACARHDLVVFVDAARGLRRPFTFEELKPEGSMPAMTHSLGPGAVLALAESLYGRTPRAYMLGVRGHAWSLGEGLSARAKADLERALAFLTEFLRERSS